ncbi:inositol monophosphatase family protein [uncultured Ruegeria sp.]|uniref:inositol monophosphatase family protein n=1 Tax=uncultured Ruegeria sp. TaxID=259304 RepID=UPI00262EB1F0|nr:inositol monophosphatase family protein [uncultured Ruegeria sp.]
MAQAAFLAGDTLLALSTRREALRIQEKTVGDFVTNADFQAEKIISAYLCDRYPDYGWLGEESGDLASGNATRKWIVDPLDGTTNFLKGLPHWAISIALYDEEIPVAAIVYDPCKSELFAAERGQGAFLNGGRIQVSQKVEMSAAILATGVPAGGRVTYLPNCLTDIEKIMPVTAGIRRWGAAALDLAYVASGRVDAYWERNLGVWDVAAGVLLVQEAGGKVERLWRKHSVLSSGSLVAGDEELLEKIMPYLDRRLR